MKNFLLKGKIYKPEAVFYPWDEEKQYPHYEVLYRLDLGIFQFNTLDEAEAFFDKHYHFLKQGGAIIEVDENGEANGNSFILFEEKVGY
jgi:hypothetical protein